MTAAFVSIAPCLHSAGFLAGLCPALLRPDGQHVLQRLTSVLNQLLFLSPVQPGSMPMTMASSSGIPMSLLTASGNFTN